MAGGFTNAGTLTLKTDRNFDAGVSVSTRATLFSAGTVTNTGTIESARGATNPFTNNSLEADLVNQGSLKVVHDLRIHRTFTQTASGSLRVEMGNTVLERSHPVLNTGQATLAGELAIDTSPTFTPSIGQTFTIVTFPSRMGTFTSFQGLDANGIHYNVTHNSGNVTLTVQQGNTPPTANGSIPSVNVDEDAPDTAIDLRPYFADAQDGAAGLTYTVTVNSNPALFSAVSVNNATDVLTLDYAANAHGTATLTVRGTDGGGLFVESTFTITVTPVNDAPSFTKGDDQPVLEDSGAASVTGWATGFVAGPANESGQAVLEYLVSSDNPALFSLQPAVAADGTLTFTPLADANGTATVTVQVRDDGGTPGVDTSAAQTFVIDVTAVNDAPVLTVDATGGVTEDALSPTLTDSGTLSFTDADTADTHTVGVVYNADAVWSGGTLTAAQAATISSGFTADTDGWDYSVANADVRFLSAGATITLSFDVTVTDDSGAANDSDTQTATITITGTNSAPRARPAFAWSIPEDGALLIGAADGLLSGFFVTDDDGDPLSIAIVQDPAHGELTLEADGSFRYLPDPDYSNDPSNPDTFQFRAFDGQEYSSDSHGHILIVVRPVNDAPQGADQTVTTAEDVAYTFTPEDFGFTDPRDVPSHALLEVVIGTLPTEGTLALDGGAINAGDVVSAADLAAGRLGFTPAANANGAGSASFTFQVRDDGGTADGGTPLDPTANVLTIDVTPVNDAPVVVRPVFAWFLREDNTLFIEDVLIEEFTTDADGDALTAELVEGPCHGTLTLLPDGSFTYQPEPDYAGEQGPDSFSYRIFDGELYSNTGMILIAFGPVNDAPTPAADSLSSIAEDSGPRAIAVSALLGNDSAGPANESGQVLTLVAVGDAVGGTVAIQGTDVVFTPSPNYNGPAGFRYTVQDDGTTFGSPDFLTGYATVSFTIAPVNDAPVALPATVALDEDEFALSLTGTDVETLPADLVFTITTLPAWGKLYANGQEVLLNANFGGSPQLTYRLNDGQIFVSDSFEFKVTDSGDPVGVPSSGLTSGAARIDLVPAAGVVLVVGTGLADTVSVAMSANGSSLTVDGFGSRTYIQSAVSRVRVFGRAGTDSLSVTGSNASEAFLVDAESVSFSTRQVDRLSVEQLTVNGWAGNDTFTVDTLQALTATFIGGSGSDTLIGADRDNAWALASPGKGTLNHISFETFESLTGGQGDDVFRFTPTGHVNGSILAGGEDTLDYSAYGKAIGVNLIAKKATGVGGTVTDIEVVVGGASTRDFLIGENTANEWSLTGRGIGTLHYLRNDTEDVTVRFSGLESLNGGSASDLLTVETAGSLRGVFSGGAGSDRVAGPDADNTWNVKRPNLQSALIGRVNFTYVEDLVGGTGSDTFRVLQSNPALETIRGGDGADRLDFSALALGLSVDLLVGQIAMANHITRFDSLEAFVGSRLFRDSLTGVAENTWVVNGRNRGQVNDVTFVGFESLNGGAGRDTFAFEGPGRLEGNLKGNGGDNLLDYSALTTAVSVNLATRKATRVAGTASDLTGVTGGSAFDVLQGANVENDWQLTSAGSGTLNGTFPFAAIDQLVGGTQVNTFHVGVGGSLRGSIVGGNQQDTLYGPEADAIWNITATNTGDIAGRLRFKNIENLVGGDQHDDRFVFEARGRVNSLLAGTAAGHDTLDFFGYDVPVTVNLQTDRATALGLSTLIDGFEEAVGSAFEDVLVGPNAETAWALIGAGEGEAQSLGLTVVFSGFDNLTGGALADTFAFGVEGFLPGTLDGGGGSDTLVGPDADSTWEINTVNGGEIDRVLRFSNTENLIGGAGDDTFSFSNYRVDGVVAGGGGSNALDYTRSSGSVTVNLAQGTATRTGGISGIVNVTGSDADDFLYGDASANVLVGGEGADVLFGGAGDDTLLGEEGRDLLLGGTGADALDGGDADDILVGAVLLQIDDVTAPPQQAVLDQAITQIMSTWRGTGSYAVRVAGLSSTSPGQVFDDQAADTLSGADLDDWFLVNGLDVLTDLEDDELAALLP